MNKVPKRGKTQMTIETYGFDGLEETFNNFQYKDKRNIMIAAFRKATKPTVEIARSNAPKGRTNNLYKSIGVVPIQDAVGVWIGARVIGGYRGFHGHLVEDGTVERSYISKKGILHRTGKMNPGGSYAHFFKRAFDATEDQAIRTIQDEWYNAIGRFIVRNKKDR